MVAKRSKRRQAIIKEKSPLDIEIKLFDQTWYQHILLFHPEMQGELELVRKGITSPEEILENKQDARYNHLHYLKVKGKFGVNKFLKLAVCVNKNDKTGFITTVHPVMDIYGGRRIWIKR